MKTSIIAINIFIITLLLSFIHIKKMGSSWSRFFLSLCLAIFLISLLEMIGWITGFFEAFPFAAFWAPLFVLLFGPGMYLFTKSVLNTRFAFKNSDALHFIPFFLALPAVQINYQRLPYSSKKEAIHQALNNPPSGVGVITIVVFATIAIYLYYSFREINKHKAKLNMEYADLQNKSVGWLSTILVSFLLIFLLSLFQNFLRFRSPGWWHASVIGSSLLFIYIGSRLLFKFMDYQSPFLSLDAVPEKPDKSREELDKLNDVARVLARAMEEEKYFLRSDITLHSLADELDLKPAIVSQSLNQVLQKNFFDYINKQRIDYACQLLKTYTSKEKNITEIMYESGFNSKSSFNTAFRKYLGVTPSSFRKES